MVQVTDSYLFNETALLLSAVFLTCFAIIVVLLSTSVKVSDIKYYFKCCCCCCSKRGSNTRSGESPPRNQDINNFVDCGDIGEVIDFSIQSPDSNNDQNAHNRNSSENSTIPNSLMVDPYLCFDRRRVHFTSIGTRGKFGNVSKGMFIAPDGSKRDVIIRSLSKDKTNNNNAAEFFNDLLKFHEVDNDNIIKLIGIDYAEFPYLAIFDDGNIGDLKMFLSHREESGRSFVKEEIQLSFCRDIVSGLRVWHQNFTIPLDFGARTCQLSSSFQIKIGDIWDAKSLYPHEYVDIYELMNKQAPKNVDRLYPIRWLSPEIIQGLRRGHVPSFITRQNNIWSLGMTFWEILQFGREPFPLLSNRQVLFGDTTSKLETTLSFENSASFCFEDKVIHDLLLKCLQIDPRNRSDIFTIYNFLTCFISTPPQERQTLYPTMWEQAFPK